MATLAVFGMLLTGTLVASAPAYATDYPTWNDVASVRNDEAATKAAIAKIEGMLAGLQAEAERTQADAEAKGIVWAEADTKFQEAAYRARNLQEQADAANATAVESEQRAGQWAAQLARSGGGDITADLFTNSGNADHLLYGLGMSSKISDQAYAIYETRAARPQHRAGAHRSGRCRQERTRRAQARRREAIRRGPGRRRRRGHRPR